jgi:cell division protein FtsI/penicillin-binding protein 2
MMSKTRKLFIFNLGVVLPLLLMAFLVRFYMTGDADITQHETERVQKIHDFRKMIADALSAPLLHNQRVQSVELKLHPELEEPKTAVQVEYTIDENLQKEAEKLLRSYHPDYGAIVTMDATTGRILTMASYQKNEGEGDTNLALRATYPAASVFKIVTATAALDKYELSPDTLVMYNGGNHTLYRKNVMNSNVNRWTRNITLREAFARSINTVFARLSFERLQPKDLREYAIRFGFNQTFPTDLPVDPSFTDIPEEKNFHLAEVASGYNKVTTMSPIQGAMIAASVAQDGVMRVPYIVERVRDDKGQVLFQSEPVTAAVTMTHAGAQRLKELMEATVTSGTGRKSFRSLVRDRKFEELEMGGKTGSLHGDNPKGKVDWFVGYAISEKSRLAVAAITVNKEKWTVKATYLAQSVFRKHFGEQFSKNNEKFMSSASVNDPNHN